MPKDEKKQASDHSLTRKPSKKSERVVVDEIFEDGLARLLRAKRAPKHPDDDLGIHTWDEEREDFIEAWRVEAFVGFPTQRSLGEGDVFFIVDGSKLNKDYKPIEREVARSVNLLRPWDESTEMARAEIKKQFYKLSAAQIAAGKKRDTDKLIRRVDKKFETNSQ
jgi:hypothetical protein